jgi:Zn-dependent metalloprotease
MKKTLLSLTIIALVTTFTTYAQISEIEQIEYSSDSIPILIKFKVNKNLIQLQAKEVIRKNLKLTKEDDFETIKTFTDELGYTHERLQHYFKGLTVEFSQYTVHSKGGYIQSISGNLKKIKSIDITPTLAENEALDLALKYVNADTYMWEVEEMEDWIKKERKDDLATYYPKGKLLIWTDGKSDTTHLAYKFNVYAHIPLRHDYIYVDAHTGNIIDVQQILKNTAVIGTAATRYSGIRSITTNSIPGGFELFDPSRGDGIETRNMEENTIIALSVPFVDNNNNWTAAEWNNADMDNAALDAHHAAQLTYDYFKQHPYINRDGWDGDNAMLRLYVHYWENWNNGGWDGTENHIILGDGDGTNYNPLTDLDVIAHEYGHAISDDEVGLNTNGQPGALDEGLSDIWAACVEQYAAIPGNNIWVMGEDWSLTANHRRNIQNPSSSHYHVNANPANPAISYPDTYLGWGWYTGSWDNYGRHINCTVLSHWFYLLSQGGSGKNDNGNSYNVLGIGINAAARIVYQMERDYLTASSTFEIARTYSTLTATYIYGANSLEVMQVKNAWYAVGLETAPTQINVTGNPNICLSSTNLYTLTNVPSGCTISWSTSTGSLQLVSSSGNTAYFRGLLNGPGLIQATITSPSGNVSTITYNVWIGIPYTPTSITGFCCNGMGFKTETAYVFSTSMPGATQYNWIVSGGVILYGQGTNSITVLTSQAPPSGISFDVSVRAGNTCGWSGYLQRGGFVAPFIGTAMFSVYPNPTSSEVTISVSDLNSLSDSDSNFENVSISNIEIIDPFGNIKKKIKTGSDQKAVTINISDISKGIYIVKIGYGLKEESHKLLIK